ncbi:Permease of the drug [Dehalobacter sp. UNSWDHB]|jgi:Permeases of the drug/metabolite transporter (DMT) superfamily|uniref:DMT family transporter n=1 Tax=unclassified Dehalobacter TaxID=2635733 RepID=UPI00028A4261|nr:MULTISPECIES: DMT family transporter [unclassified Dehalobacter]AFV01727.1 Permeases of the drug/metabolite transporter (DMT) superfamily [Dehalobacter sp. DCA]AFV04765.1 Permeases of the drug/metabolite transporter (DMT) superfamily [Dehalobacter sp. CF]EQB21455.1 Permease of the drug [Dehalobacter sp. UNSWDHB]
MQKQKFAVFQALLAAALFGISTPLSKLLLSHLSPIMIAALLYLGAGTGMFALRLIIKVNRPLSKEAGIARKDLPFTIGMVILDISAPILLLVGLSTTAAANVALLSNFEIAATALLALWLFKETIGQRLWTAIILITASSMLLSLKDIQGLSFSAGSIFVLLACLCWGLENNFTKMLSLKDPMQIVVIKGLGSGTGSLLIAFVTKQMTADYSYILFTLILGFFAYGLSIFFYVRAQRDLGAARTSAYYAVAPFIGVGLSFIVAKEPITNNFIIAAILMIFGAYYAAREKHDHQHSHEVLCHEHRHHHGDGHHTHVHGDFTSGEHSHPHEHETIEHAHHHAPDMHHKH